MSQFQDDYFDKGREHSHSHSAPSVLRTFNGVLHKRCARCRLYFPATRRYFFGQSTVSHKLNCYCKGCHMAICNRYKAAARTKHIDTVARRRRIAEQQDAGLELAGLMGLGILT